MAMQSVLLKPGVNIEFTPALNEAGISQSQLIRTKSGLTQSYGGWMPFGIAAIPSTVRDLHAWQDIAGTDLIAAGATQNLIAVTVTSNQDITPVTLTSDVVPNFSVSSGSNIVTVVDANSEPSPYNTVFFNTPIAIGNLLLTGSYQIAAALSTGSYTILSSVAASVTVANSGILPGFNTTSGLGIVTVTLPNNTAIAGIGQLQPFYAPTVVDGFTIQGGYNVLTVTSSVNQFTFSVAQQATTTSCATMNSCLAEMVYYITQGPPPAGAGYGAGGYGLGGYGIGTTGGLIASKGNSLVTTDWSMDNWGEILLACPKNGAVYQWAPDGGFLSAKVVPEAPFFNGGLFVSMPQQVLVLWKSCQSTGVQDNLIVRWSDAEDFTNWTVSNQTIAGSFHIPTGSVIVGGMQAPNYGVIWTDIDVWIMQYVNAVIAFNFTRAGSGCGLIGQHAGGVIAGEVYWCGKSNFFKMGNEGVSVVPCSVWDFIFQNLNSANAYKIRCAPNSAFNEISWFFPSTGATENDSYVKFNILEQTWDYGSLSRTAWTDISVVGGPVGADTTGTLQQHETGNLITGTSAPSFKTGWWAISDGLELSFVDFVMPDFIWGTYGTTTASLQVTFFSADYPGDTPTTYGPYTVTRATEYITPRIRGRLMAMQVQSATDDVFWRLGRIRYRWAPSGRR